MDGPLARAVVEPQSTKDLEAVLGSLPCSPFNRRDMPSPALPTESPWPCDPGHPLWAGWPWALGHNDRSGPLGRRSASATHTGTPVRIIPPGGHPPKCVVNPTRFARGSEVCVVLAMLDVLASALRSILSAFGTSLKLSGGPRSYGPTEDRPIVDLRLCSSARLARGSGRRRSAKPP